MRQSALRRMRRLRALAETVIAKQRWYGNYLPDLAEEHLLRVIAVFRFGDPRIDEPLGRAYRRACSHLAERLCLEIKRFPQYRTKHRGLNEADVFSHLRRLLRSESASGDIKSEFCTCVSRMPDWLRHLCFVEHSMEILGLEATPLSEDMRKLRPNGTDWAAWPRLPEGILEPCPEDGEQRRSFLDEMSPEEQTSFLSIMHKPLHELTRHEHRFVREMYDREP
jgi:hypothetical protein